MKTLLLVGFLAMAAVPSRANARSADSAARKLCSSIAYDTDRGHCMDLIQGVRFDAGALRICRSINFDREKIECLGVIADKTYSSEEITTCSALERDIDKRNCLLGSDRYRRPAPGRDSSCDRTIEAIGATCGLSWEQRDRLRRNANSCDAGTSQSGKTETAALLKRGSREVLIVNTRGQGACRIEHVHFGRGGGAEYLLAVHGERHSDKIFFRMGQGQLFYMDMGHDFYEVLNSDGESYDITRIDDLGNETLELTHRAGNRSTLTFDQIDQRWREGKLSRVDVTWPGSWEELLNLMEW